MTIRTDNFIAIVACALTVNAYIIITITTGFVDTRLAIVCVANTTFGYTVVTHDIFTLVTRCYTIVTMSFFTRNTAT